MDRGVIFIIGWLFILLGVALMLTGCVSPKEWRPDAHHDTMMVCRSMCGKDRVQSYVPFTGECTCEAEKK
jgi:hypothetical protein